MTSQELIKLLKENDWFIVKGGKGSHTKLKHSVIKGRVIVPKDKHDIPIGTKNSILKKAGLK